MYYIEKDLSALWTNSKPFCNVDTQMFTQILCSNIWGLNLELF